MKVFESQNIVIERDDELKCLIQNWKGFASSERFREGIQKSIDLFKDKKLNKILSNTKDFGMVKKEDTEWVNSYSMPLLIKDGLKYMAFVVPSNVFSQMSVENFKKQSEGPVEIRYFDDVSKAKEWMAELP
ncbi:hypothetical protein [Nafulsella turpanensis]|uniref:hypothetical protein n=1 Tax=Nafulsella turpanensis TaxID=1265690 RepID=UPI00034A160D|nr:hypothetical protein [Nafulsella turpanensis]